MVNGTVTMVKITVFQKGFLEPAVFPQINKVLKSYEIPVAKSICIHPVCQRIQGVSMGSKYQPRDLATGIS